MSEAAMAVDDAGQVQVQDAPPAAAEEKSESLYGSVGVKKDEPVDDGMIKVRDDIKDGETAEEKKEEETRLYANKYKTPDDLEKAYTELQKKFSRGDHKPVDLETYKHDKLEEFGIPDDDPLLQGFNAFAKEKGFSREDYDGLINTFLEAVGAQDVQVKQAREQIMQELGPNADGIVRDMGQWAQGLAQAGIWTAEELEWFKAAADSAVGTRALMKVRESYADRIAFKAPPAPSAGKITKDELEQLMGERDQQGELRYYNDPVYRAEVDRKAAASFG